MFSQNLNYFLLIEDNIEYYYYKLCNAYCRESRVIESQHGSSELTSSGAFVCI